MANETYKLIIKNSKAVLKTISNGLIYLTGIKDVSASGNVSNTIVDWSIQHKTKTSSEWSSDTTTILLRGQIGVEDTGNSSFKLKIGNGTDLWSDLSYAAGGGSGSVSWGSIGGNLPNQTDLQTALNAKQNSLGFTPEDSLNKSSSYTLSSTTTYPNTKALVDGLTTKEDAFSKNSAFNKNFGTGTDNIVEIGSPLNNSLPVVTDLAGKIVTNTVSAQRTLLGVGSGHIIVTSGTSFTTPSTITTSTVFYIWLIGGGGGGGGANLANATASGGAGGGLCYVKVTGLSPSTTYTCAIGAGGTAGAATPTNGGAGGNTTLTIGATTYTASGGAGGIAAVSSAGGAAGTGTNGDINLAGQNGGDSPTASAGSTDGTGGDSPMGWGTGGTPVKVNSAGKAGTGYGAGGSGGKGTSQTGGAGSAGLIFCIYVN